MPVLASGAAMRRRSFISLLGGAVVWPVAMRAQQSEGTRRIGILMNRSAEDPQGRARVATFQQRLQQLGWTNGSNLTAQTMLIANAATRQNWSH